MQCPKSFNELKHYLERKEKRVTTIERLLFTSITAVIEEFRYSISKVFQKEI
jgi:hypothetical protein